ncbi:hypothetical protein VTL71DRAFT_2898 [Oculimacula yallundae]|uniref:FAD-binding PCMH-type domain-containing protein n=1 Tax=Oculimacula yallundae TaxID=86028 RepID=A0ABR4C5K4_9HELO
MSSSHLKAVEAAQALLLKLSSSSRIFTDSSCAEVKDLLMRWSDVDIQTPSAILQPSNANDISIIVRSSTKHSIALIASSGGHSNWSTIGPGGWILDLSLLTSISISPTQRTATILGGTLTKPILAAVSSAGYLIHTANASGVGHVGFLLGGGNSVLVGQYGMAVDALISARVVTATGDIVTASEEENADLFWALKGAGCYFGIVSELTVRIFPKTTEIVNWTCVFKPEQVEEVGRAVKMVSDGNDRMSFGSVLVTLPPGPAGPMKPIIIVSMTHFRSLAEAEEIMQPILSIGPVAQIKKSIEFADITDAADRIDKKGGLKSIVSCGMQSFDPVMLEKSLDAWVRLVDAHPGAKDTFFILSWSSTEGMREFEGDGSAYGHRDVGSWCFIWPSGTDEVSFQAAVKTSEELVDLCQAGQDEDEKSSFPSHSRTKSVEQRYRGEEMRKRLGDVKRIWDPEGVFTRHFL